MKNFIQHDPWKIIETGWHPEYNLVSESLFSLGNGRFGQRANFEEQFSGQSMQGTYVAGVYYPDKTKVGWWKIGYPEYFAKVLNAPNWSGIELEIEGEKLDLNQCEVKDFSRVLDLKEGFLERAFTAKMKSGKMLRVVAKRFCSIADDEIAAIRYSFKPLNFSATVSINVFVDGDVVNKDSNYEEKFWIGIDAIATRRKAFVVTETRKTGFQVCTGMKFSIFKNDEEIDFSTYRAEREKYAGCQVEMECTETDQVDVYKYVSVVSSLNYPKESLLQNGKRAVKRAFQKGFDTLMKEHATAWANIWEHADILIEGDVAAQQGIRFNIFQLYQTYTGKDDRLNIGPKGFTGEKYGGSTYWDTEAYCLPFYLATAAPQVARNLLLYRYKHLSKAIENAEKLGFSKGAALYPMVTMNGEECHNEWEITFEEIHRNGAIAFAIYDYVRYTGDKQYLTDYGLEVLIGIARFWSQRVHFSERKNQFVIHGVTGPNEYENNVNNNWYTNYLAVWCLQYAIEVMEFVKSSDPAKFEAFCEQIKFYEYTETNHWKQIIQNMYLPKDESLGIFIQNDGFLEKELLTVADLDNSQRPINQHWSWDRILRSVFIKQADVLQGIYLFEEDFDMDTIRSNFNFYEPRTVHESSLSPCVHAILAAKLGLREKAYDLYLRTARLDLDDYNNDTEDGCHITSMAGTWMAVVKGFGGMRAKQDRLTFDPSLPEQWENLSFHVNWREHLLFVQIWKTKIEVSNHAALPLTIELFGKDYAIDANAKLVHSL